MCLYMSGKINHFIEKGVSAKSAVIMSCVVIAAAFFVCMNGCGIEKIDTKMVNELQYEEVEEENIPEEVYEKILRVYDSFGRFVYICSDSLYIVVCYGAQPTEGYSIEVNQLYESSNAILVETTLKGPAGPDKPVQNITYPYIVLKLEKNEKIVVFK